MYILASKSPRRHELLKQVIPEFQIICSNVDESKIQAEPHELPKVLSKLKAEAIFKDHPNDIIIAADTIVLFNEKIYGKPQDENDAFRMLKDLSNETHEVITGFTILSKDTFIVDSVTTKVTFNYLSDQLILNYIKECQPLDKAGAYGIQDKVFNLVKQIDGSYSNVMGLPIEKLKMIL